MEYDVPLFLCLAAAMIRAVLCCTLVMLVVNASFGSGLRVRRGFQSGLTSGRDYRGSDERDTSVSREDCACASDMRTGNHEYQYGRGQQPWGLQRRGRTVAKSTATADARTDTQQTYVL